jgi:hypothetical protein
MLLYTTPAGVKTSAPRRGGFVIVAVLMVVTVLSLAAYQYSSLMDAEVMAADRIRKTAESRAAADSAIHYVMGYLADQNAFTGTLNSNPFDNPTSFQGVLVNQGPGPKSTCRFSIITPDYRQDSSVGSLPLVYGLTDESGKLNINALFALDSSGKVLHDALMKLGEPGPLVESGGRGRERLLLHAAEPIPVQEWPARFDRGVAAGQGGDAEPALRDRQEPQRHARPRRGRRDRVQRRLVQFPDGVQPRAELR